LLLRGTATPLTAGTAIRAPASDPRVLTRVAALCHLATEPLHLLINYHLLGSAATLKFTALVPAAEIPDPVLAGRHHEAWHEQGRADGTDRKCDEVELDVVREPIDRLES
jgi:hypothetical protein